MALFSQAENRCFSFGLCNNRWVVWRSDGEPMG